MPPETKRPLRLHFPGNPYVPPLPPAPRGPALADSSCQTSKAHEVTRPVAAAMIITVTTASLRLLKNQLLIPKAHKEPPSL